MTLLTRKDLENFKKDIQTLSDVINGPPDFNGDGNVISREGHKLKTMSKIQEELSEIKRSYVAKSAPLELRESNAIGVSGFEGLDSIDNSL